MAKYSKEDAIKIIVQCAEKYHTELEGKNLLFMCSDKHKRIIPVEVSFNKGNYMHLTGVKSLYDDEGNSNLYANDFYHKCLEHRLSPSDFEFSKDGTTFMKLDVLPSLICKNLCARMIGDYNSSKPYLCTEKIVGNIHACIGFVYDNQSLQYVPNTVIKENDIRDLTINDIRVIATYRKPFSAEQYSEITYVAKKVNLEDFYYPEEYQYLLRL